MAGYFDRLIAIPGKVWDFTWDYTVILYQSGALWDVLKWIIGIIIITIVVELLFGGIISIIKKIFVWLGWPGMSAAISHIRINIPVIGPIIKSVLAAATTVLAELSFYRRGYKQGYADARAGRSEVWWLPNWARRLWGVKKGK